MSTTLVCGLRCFNYVELESLVLIFFFFVDAEARVCESDLPVGTNKETLNFELVTTP